MWKYIRAGGQEKLVLSENLLGHSLSFNRVVFSAARLLSYRGSEEN